MGRSQEKFVHDLIVLCSMIFVFLLFCLSPMTFAYLPDDLDFVPMGGQGANSTEPAPSKPTKATYKPAKPLPARQEPVDKQKPVEKEPLMGPKPKLLHYAGKVVGLDLAAKTLVVRGKKTEMQFDVANAEWEGYKALNEVKASDEVVIKYINKGGRMVAALVALGAIRKKAPISR
jgi:hypothetical protein